MRSTSSMSNQRTILSPRIANSARLAEHLLRNGFDPVQIPLGAQVDDAVQTRTRVEVRQLSPTSSPIRNASSSRARATL
jgi:hypothetical protein